MGLADRTYSRDVYRPRSGIGSMRLLSFNAWLIIINVAIFLFDAIAGFGLPVKLGERFVQGTPADAVVRERGDFLTESGQTATLSQRARVTTGNRPTTLYKVLVDDRSGQTIGRADYVVRPPFTAIGLFSTHHGFEKLQVWRLVTYQFLHANLMHLLMNMLGLWIFGGMVERELGFKRYAALYLVCGIFGGLCFLVLNLLGHLAVAGGLGQIPGLLFESKYIPLVGASAGVFGVIMAGAYLKANEMIHLPFPPIEVRLNVVAYAFVAIAALNLFMGGENAGGDAAHIGGALAGYYFIRNVHLLRDFFDVLQDSRRPRETPRTRRVSLISRGGRAVAAAPRRDQERQRRDDAEVDRILDKVRASGTGSLSDAEKRTLRLATERQRSAG